MLAAGWILACDQDLTSIRPRPKLVPPPTWVSSPAARTGSNSPMCSPSLSRGRAVGASEKRTPSGGRDQQHHRAGRFLHPCREAMGQGDGCGRREQPLPVARSRPRARPEGTAVFLRARHRAERPPEEPVEHAAGVVGHEEASARGVFCADLGGPESHGNLGRHDTSIAVARRRNAETTSVPARPGRREGAFCATGLDERALLPDDATPSRTGAARVHPRPVAGPDP